MMMKVMTHPGLKFYQDLCDPQGLTSYSLEGMLLYPLKILAFVVLYSAFVDYCQMSFQFEYLWVPDEVDLYIINQLLCHVHGVNGMMGSSDCSHTIWKNCPKAWAGSFQCKEITPKLCWRVFLIITFLACFLWICRYP
ncbi:hypothetical protein ACHAW6_003029 [Cyclotella cf. meneghiniana]